jgi:hypothetical protein
VALLLLLIIITYCPVSKEEPNKDINKGSKDKDRNKEAKREKQKE